MVILKEAGFLEGAAQTVLSRFSPSQWVNKPFETIFSAIGPMVLLRISWPIGIMAFIGEHYGFGPGLIGKLIDGHLKTGGGKIDLSNENLQQASKSAIDDFLQKTKGFQATSADTFLQDLIQIKGSINKEDIVTAFYMPIEKTAARPGMIRKLLGLISGPKYSAGIQGALYGILKTLAIGIAGAAAVGGVAHMFGGTPATKQETKEVKQEKNNQYYSNVAKNVENTIITFLDATIEGFSITYERMYKKKLSGSKELKEILDIIESMNKSTISNINSWDAFMAPSVLNIAYKLMPNASYEKIEEKQVPEKQVSKKVAPTKTQNPKDKLIELLNGV